MKYLCLIILLVLSFNSSIAQNIDASVSLVEFEIKNMGVKTVNGTFKGMSGNIHFPKDNLDQAAFNVCIDAATVNTGNNKRDKHLRTEDYFHVEQYPKICFVSSEISTHDEGFITKGKLTMHGVTKMVEIPFTYANKTFKGNLELNRKDFNIGPNGGFMVGKSVTLNITCQLL